MTNYTLKNVSERDLKNYELSVTNSYRKIPKIPLPPSVTSTVSMPLTEEFGNTFTELDQFLDAVVLRLLRIRYEGQKNRLYKITILMGNFDDVAKPLSGNVLSMQEGKSELPHL